MKLILSFSLILLVGLYPNLLAQQGDSLNTIKLDEVIVHSQHLYDVQRMPLYQATYIFSGKKSEAIQVQNLDANIAEKTPRQVFAKVPGVFVYDMDGTGNQTNISTRGLDAHRGWEFNTRENGIITNSDMYGYPASHYSMPMEAVERIELVRGTGSLQYGAQFGGMLNYVTKKPDSARAIVFETVNTVGSFGLLSTYNAISGTLGKFQYYAYFNKRVSSGYRTNSKTDFDAESIVLIYRPVQSLKLKAEVARSNYVYQIPGPLTDSMWYADPKYSTRSRNYFNPEIFVPSFSMEWELNRKTLVSWVVSAVLGNRNSVQFDKPATVVDAIDPITLSYAPRQVDIDHFKSFTSELRLLHHYQIGKLKSTVAAGVQLIDNDLHRQQLGTGTTGTDFDLTLTEPGWGRDLHFKTKNIAFFAENNVRVLPGLMISPGLRMELGASDMTGTISYYDPGNLPNSISHRFPLLGVSAEYTFKGNNFYGGWSQAYRPVIFKDIIPTSTYEQVDKNLKDAFGYNLDIGYRGSWKFLRWDVSGFLLQYNNRLGSLAETNPDDGSFYIYRTNIGNAVTKGLELFAEFRFNLVRDLGVSAFTSTSFFDARYQEAFVRSGESNIDVSGNKVEAVPDWISRNGLTFHYRVASLSILYSYTGESYADALNTVKPSTNGAIGLVPSYGILDINGTWRFYNGLVLRLGINNVTNEQYFTKRPSFYPGPGVWSSDGRSINVSIGIKI